MRETPEQVARVRFGRALAEKLVEAEHLIDLAESKLPGSKELADLKERRTSLEAQFEAVVAKDDEEENQRTPEYEAAHEAVFRNLHAFLGAAANISKILWPSTGAPAASAEEQASLRAQHRDRGRRLRRRFRIGELPAASDLKDITMRHHFEHFDERIHAWTQSLGEEPWAFYVPVSIGGRDAYWGDQIPTGIMRHLDPDTLVIHALCDTADLGRITAALQELRERAALVVGDAGDNKLLVQGGGLEDR